MKKILILDNYDSFIYNILHAVERLGYEADVYRNDKISLDAVGAYDKIILSPGPGIPSEAGILCDVIRRYGATKSIFGVCLGEQAIGEVYGATLENLSKPYHGVATMIEVTQQEPLFEGLPQELEVGRYHSWCVSSSAIPECLEVTALDKEEQRVMALRHKQHDVRGVQFHPESILTPDGEAIIGNWLKM